MTDKLYNTIQFTRRIAMVLDLFNDPLPYDSGKTGFVLAWGLAKIAYPYAAEERRHAARIREIVRRYNVVDL